MVLVGSLSAPRLYGAGLLSSVMESKSCLGEKVRKIQLSKDAVETAYDITEPQPQLFVARDFADLHQTLSEVEKDMSYKLGGLEGLRRAKKISNDEHLPARFWFAGFGTLDTFYYRR